MTVPGRQLWLGRRRLRAVDASGRWGIADHWFWPPRGIDLVAPAWKRRTSSFGQRLMPAVTAAGIAIVGSWALRDREPRHRLFAGLTAVDLQHLTPDRVITSAGDPALRAANRFRLTRDDRLLWVILADDTLSITEVDPPHRWRVLDPIPRGVIQQAVVHDSRTWLAAATRGEVRVHGFSGGALGWCHVARTDDSDAHFLGSGGSRLILLTRIAVGFLLRVWNVDEPRGAVELEYAIDLASPLDSTTASVSADGQLLAAARGNQVLVVELSARSASVLAGHTHRVSFVAFAGGDRMLISADDDGRVLIRPRGPSGYDVPVLTTAVAPG